MSGVEVIAASSAIGSVTGAVTLADVAIGVGSLFSAVSSISQGNAARAAGKYNSEIYARNAEIARQTAQVNEDRQRRAATQREGANVAAIGASGLDMTGSALDLLESNAAQEEQDALMIRWNGQNSATSMDAQGMLSDATGRNQQTQGYMGAGASLFLGASRIGSRGYGRSSYGYNDG